MATSENPGECVICAGLASHPGGSSNGFSLRISALALIVIVIFFRSRRSKKPGPEDPNASLKRTTIILILFVLAFTTIVVLFTRVGRGLADKDPFLDPMANPNIKVQVGRI